MKLKFIFIVFVLLLIIFFFPKLSSHGGSHYGAKNSSCKCLGFEKKNEAIGKYRNICYGIPYSCSVQVINF